MEAKFKVTQTEQRVGEHYPFMAERVESCIVRVKWGTNEDPMLKLKSKYPNWEIPDGDSGRSVSATGELHELQAIKYEFERLPEEDVEELTHWKLERQTN
jgi:hypothetical protein